MNASDLFKVREPWQCNAMLRGGDLMFEESYYVYGFIDSALIVMAKVINDAICPYEHNEVSCKYPLVNMEDLIYPIMFNLRHGLEIWLKWKINQSVKMGLLPKACNGHSIGKLYKKLKSAHMRSSNIIAMFEEVEPLFVVLDEIDGTGQVFRYDTGSRGTPHLEDEKCINVALLHDKTIEFKGKIKTIDAEFARNINASRV